VAGAPDVVDINQDRTIRIKIVYYGPALGGKTTSLRVLHERALWSRHGEFVSVNSMQDRTILCDLLPLRTGAFRGYDLKLQLLAVPGHAMCGATRRAVLKAADGVVLVANSASDRFHENT
jgi:signal recognition particle receptor subunit beta